MRNKILLDTLTVVAAERERLPAVQNVALSRYFTTVTLSDGCVGSCMSFYSAADEDLCATGAALEVFLKEDLLRIAEFPPQAKRLLTGALVPQADNLYSSLLASVVSAASAPLLQGPGQADYAVSTMRPEKWFSSAHSALVVGFGGFLGELCEMSTIRWIHVIDLGYESQRDEIESYLQTYRRRSPDRRFTASTSLNLSRSMNSFDLACITGSTLCNDSLERFLRYKAPGSRLILQGQSASIYPRCLFSAGVDGVATTIKPAILSQLAKDCYDGERLRPYLEGNLPWIYLSPGVIAG